MQPPWSFARFGVGLCRRATSRGRSQWSLKRNHPIMPTAPPTGPVSFRRILRHMIVE